MRSGARGVRCNTGRRGNQIMAVLETLYDSDHYRV